MSEFLLTQPFGGCTALQSQGTLLAIHMHADLSASPSSDLMSEKIQLSSCLTLFEINVHLVAHRDVLVSCGIILKVNKVQIMG